MNAIRRAIGRDAFMGYRINSTSLAGDLEIDQVKDIVRDLERLCRPRLRERFRRRSPFLHPYPDALRGRLGEGLRRRGPQGVVPAGPARRPDHYPRRRGGAPQGRPRRRHLPRPPALHRSRVGEQGARGPARTTFAAASPRTFAGAMRPPASACSASTPDHRARSGVGRHHPPQGAVSEEGARHRGRAGGARMRPGGGGARPSGHRVRA